MCIRDRPRVRPFGTAHIFEGKLYIQTGKVKEVSKQLHANSKAEICAFTVSYTHLDVYKRQTSACGKIQSHHRIRFYSSC